MTDDAMCDERHEQIRAFARVLGAGLLAAFSAIFSAYLYAASTYAEKEDVDSLRANVREMRRELRADIKDGFNRIERHLGKP